MNKMLLPIPALLLLGACDMLPTTTCAPADMIIEDGWARATLEGQPMGAAYFTLRNDGECTAVLTGASTPIAGVATLHETRTTGTMASMAPIESLQIAGGETVAFEAGGKHVMLGRLNQQLIAGERFALTLNFAEHESVEADITIVEPGAR